MIVHYLLIATGFGSSIGLTILLIALKKVFKKAPRLEYVQTNENEILDTSLSVVIPAYNEESKIEGCIKTILNSYNPCENLKIILVDDNSNDQTIKKAELAAGNVKFDKKMFASYQSL